MVNISVVIIEEDEKYLGAVEWLIMKEYGEYANIESISDRTYFNDFFARPQKIDVLIVHEMMYTDIVQKQNVGLTFLLREDGENFCLEDHLYKINKYCSPCELGNHILGTISSKMNLNAHIDKKRETKGVFVYSPIGGCGKTLTALGLCEALSRIGQKVLYMNLETVQNFQWYLEDQQEVYAGFETCLVNHENHVMSYLKQAIGHEEFDYVRPMGQSTLAYGIQEEDYLFFIDQIMEANAYDFVVFDTSSELTMFKTRLMGKCAKMLIILQQDALSVWKVEQFMKNIDYSDDSHFLYLCNNYEQQQENGILNSRYLRSCNIAEYINKENTNAIPIKLRDLKNSTIFQTTAYLLV